MFIDFAIKQSASSVGATRAGNQAYMPLLRSLVRFPNRFYKHVAPTALRLGSRSRQVFQQAVHGRGASGTDRFHVVCSPSHRLLRKSPLGAAIKTGGDPRGGSRSIPMHP